MSRPPSRPGRVRKPVSEYWKTNPKAFATAIPDYLLKHGSATAGNEKEKWIAAMRSEIQSLSENNAWSLVPRSMATNVLSCKLVYKRKLQASANGIPYTRFKARLVCRGFEQQEGVYYKETFAPVVKLTTFRIFFAMCAYLKLVAHLMDVVTAFLNGDIDKDIYIEQPEGFVSEQPPNHVCKLHKSLYGLKQAPRLWHEKIDEFLITTMNFEVPDNEACLYFQKTSRSFSMVVLYVDDLIIAATDSSTLQSIKSGLGTRFKRITLALLTYI